jgi:hypothetical protein
LMVYYPQCLYDHREWGWPLCNPLGHSKSLQVILLSPAPTNWPFLTRSVTCWMFVHRIPRKIFERFGKITPNGNYENRFLQGIDTSFIYIRISIIYIHIYIDTLNIYIYILTYCHICVIHLKNTERDATRAHQNTCLEI